jgi:hypothetical protein
MVFPVPKKSRQQRWQNACLNCPDYINAMRENKRLFAVFRRMRRGQRRHPIN